MPPVVAGATAISGSSETTGEPLVSNNGARNSAPTGVGPWLPNVNVASMSAAAGIMNVCHRYPAFPSPGHDALPPRLIVKFVAPVPEDCVNVAVPLFVAPEAGLVNISGRNVAPRMIDAIPAIAFFFDEFICDPYLMPVRSEPVRVIDPHVPIVEKPKALTVSWPAAEHTAEVPPTKSVLMSLLPKPVTRAVSNTL